MSTMKDKILGPMITGINASGGGGGTVVVPNIQATAATLPAGSDATVTRSGSDTNPVFNFGIPQGIQGLQGPVGPTGATGATGQQGPTGPAGPQGIQGPQGAPGAPFLVSKVYANIEEMNAGFETDGLVEGQLVGISQETGGEQGGYIYQKGPKQYDFFFDLGKTEGIAGPQGPQGEQGPQGPQGPIGATGATGPAGPGVPAGGETGQVLAKESGSDYDTAWKDPSTIGFIPVLDVGTITGTPPVQVPLTPEQVAQAQLENVVAQAVYQGIALHLQKIGQSASQVVFSGFASNSNIFFFVNIATSQGTFNIVAVRDLPAGGTTGQVLTKSSDTDYDTAWADQTGGGTDYQQGNGISIQGDTISVRLSQTAGNGLVIGPDGGLWAPEGGGGGAVQLQSIAITTPPNTTEYTAGQTFDNTGMVVTAYYNLGLSEVVTGYTVSPSGALTGDITEIVISYSSGGILKTATQAITVNRLTPTLTLSEPSVELNAETPSAALTITYTGDGALSATSNYPDIVSASIEGGNTLAITSLSDTSQTARVTVSAAQTGIYAAKSVTITVYNYVAVQIYGALWDGGPDPAWSRTDGAELFADPQPAVNNGTGSSPFDEIMPWSGMTRVSDPVAGELVQIPKYWYKWIRSGASMQLQIANGPVDGFYVSPAHADRGDGQGERDIVYVGRYHCGSDYKSTTGVLPLDNITRATARTNISALGAEYWQYDFAMYWTIAMLYLVEFANWNSQAAIGYGCSPDGVIFNMGLTDAMQYHTGTSAATKNTWGCCQYRNIEGLWDNVYNWCDGIYSIGQAVYCIQNPSNFSDSTGGDFITNRISNVSPYVGYISSFTDSNIEGFEYAILPSATSGSAQTYICDSCRYTPNGVEQLNGGEASHYELVGLFYTQMADSAAQTYPQVGCRSMKLPNAT